MDRLDREHPERRSGNWTQRLNHFEVEIPKKCSGLITENKTINAVGESRYD